MSPWVSESKNGCSILHAQDKLERRRWRVPQPVPQTTCAVTFSVSLNGSFQIAGIYRHRMKPWAATTEQVSMARVGTAIAHSAHRGAANFPRDRPNTGGEKLRQLPKHGHLIESRHVRVGATRDPADGSPRDQASAIALARAYTASSAAYSASSIAAVAKSMASRA